MQIVYNDRVMNVNEGITIKELLGDEIAKCDAIAARFNNEVKSLNYVLKEDGEMSLLDISKKDGVSVKRKGLWFVIGMDDEEH